MRRLSVLLLGRGFAAAALAEPKWAGPGWYLVEQSETEGAIFLQGPFADEASCKATLPPDDEDADYYCEYHGERPAWDT